MLSIIHFLNFSDYNKFYTSKQSDYQKAHLISFKENDEIHIVKSRWFTGEHPHRKEGSHYVVDVDNYTKIAQDTIKLYLNPKVRINQ